MKGCFFDKSLWCLATGTFSNGQVQICLLCGINKRTSLKSIWCGSEGWNCCLQSRHIRSFPPPVRCLLIITSILDMKWRKKPRLCNTSDIQSCVSLWKLPNKRLSSPKPADTAGEQEQNERTRLYPQLRNGKSEDCAVPLLFLLSLFLKWKTCTW